MDNTIKFSCCIDTTDPTCTLGIEIWLDDQQIFNHMHVSESMVFEHQLLDSDATHELRFVIKGKTSSHTKIDSSSNIIADARLILRDFTFDEIKLGHMLTELATYEHDFNGTKPTVVEPFYGELGCNGTVTLKFTTPIYLWLLENM